MTLDAMRGVAAFVVVFYHVCLDTKNVGYMPRFGYLAVDMFFALSGFVLAERYDREFKAGLTTLKFMLLRLGRLYPLYLCGLLLGTIAIFPQYSTSAATLTNGALHLVENMLLVPAFPRPLFNLLFPADPAAWSLFFELWIANLVFALLWRQLHGVKLCIFLLFCAMTLFLLQRTYYNFNVGAFANELPGGASRTLFSFFAGVAVSRIHSDVSAPARIPSSLAIVLLCGGLFMPLGHGRTAHVYELACALFGFPALIYLSANAIERRPQVGKALGEASYAAYVVHQPLLHLAIILLPMSAVHTLAFDFAFVLFIAAAALGLERLERRPRAAFTAAIMKLASPKSPGYGTARAA